MAVVWCATEVNQTTNEILTEESWGYCNQECPFKCKIDHLQLVVTY